MRVHEPLRELAPKDWFGFGLCFDRLPPRKASIRPWSIDVHTLHIHRLRKTALNQSGA
jgi:hypothetical protein